MVTYIVSITTLIKSLQNIAKIGASSYLGKGELLAFFEREREREGNIV